jgi:hypothetical protein
MSFTVRIILGADSSLRCVTHALQFPFQTHRFNWYIRPPTANITKLHQSYSNQRSGELHHNAYLPALLSRSPPSFSLASKHIHRFLTHSPSILAASQKQVNKGLLVKSFSVAIYYRRWTFVQKRQCHPNHRFPACPTCYLGHIAIYFSNHILPPYGHAGTDPLKCCCKRADMSEITTAVNAEAASANDRILVHDIR